MAKNVSRGARFTALALATGTLVVAATGSAGAAPVAIPDVFGGSARGASLHLEINLPVAVPIPGIGTIQSLVQDISLVDGSATKGVVANPVSIAQAILGTGNLPIVSQILGTSSKSSLDGKMTETKAIVDQDLGIIKLGVGKITTSVSPEGSGTTLTSESTAQLAKLIVTLAALPNIPLKADLADVVGQLNGTVDSTQGTVSSAVDNALAVLNDVSAGATAPVAAAVQQVKGELTSLLDNLQSVLGNLSADTDLVRVALLEATDTITRTGDTVTAKAVARVGEISLLGGFVKVDAVKTESFSSANGRKGQAAADTLTTILGVKVGDVLDLKLTDKGLEGTILGNQLPPAAQNAVNQVVTAVNGVLAAAGVQIINGKKTTTIDPNGQTAASSSEGVGIVVNPLKAAKPLVLVQLVPAGTAVNAAHLAKPAKPVAGKPAPAKPLAHTGAELPLFALLGTGIAGLALVARRRRTVTA